MIVGPLREIVSTFIVIIKMTPSINTIIMCLCDHHIITKHAHTFINDLVIQLWAFEGCFFLLYQFIPVHVCSMMAQYLSDYCSRLWSQHAPDRQRQNLLHVVRASRDSSLSHHVPKCGWTPQHIRDISSQTHQKMPQAQELRGLADELNHGGNHSVQLLFVYRRRCLHPFRGLVVPGRLLLLLHHADHHRVRRLRGSTEQQRPTR